MEPSSTTRLPNEILFNIFSHFCLHCQDYYNESWDERPLRAIKPCREEQQPDAKSWYSIERNTLFAACLASKGLRDIAQPILYHEFVLGYGDSWKSDLYDWEGRLISFMRTLARRPDLCRQVKVVYINTRLFTSNDEGKRATLLEAARALKIDLPAVWNQRASNILASEAEDWPEVYSIFLSTYLDESRDLTEKQERRLRRAMDQSPAPAWRWLNSELIAMLIAQTHAVQYFSIQGNRTWPTKGLPESSLRSLGVVNLPLKTLDLGIAANSLIELSPTLRTLNLHDYSGDLSSWDTELPHLKTLRITNDYLTANTLRRLLDACTGGLVAFEFEAYKRVDESPRCGFEDYENYTPAPPHMLRDSHFQPSDVIKILQKHKNTLRILHLNLTNREYRTKKIPLDVNLKDFSTLQHVFINVFQLFGSEENIEIEHEVLIRLLPRSIVSLVIHRENFRRRCRVKEALFALADSKSRSPDHFPFLKHVALAELKLSSHEHSTTISPWLFCIVKNVPTSTGTVKKNITIVKKVIRKVNVIVVPSTKTTTTVETSTVKSTTTNLGLISTTTTTVDLSTFIDVRTSWKIETSTTSSITTKFITTTIIRPPSWTAIKGDPDWRPRKRAEKNDGFVNVEALTSNQLPQSVRCVREIPKYSTKTVTTTVKGPKITLKAATKTKTSTVPTTITITDYPNARITATEIAYLSVTTIVQDVTSTSTIPETACASNPLCVGSYIEDGVCKIYVPKDSDMCLNGGQDEVGGYMTYQELDSGSDIIFSNGPCGKFKNYGISANQD
ncbi:hypothetical protein HYE67_004885 [Fusarium culmorum]|uniref:F-box domain-containing protein n=1 Tax=Fusarium culmorum TaxID=5516 RepID=A0A7S8D5Z3_FUSCU|nr:hypothetical protein HYE67_004885 [Fusarium culmorum]